MDIKLPKRKKALTHDYMKMRIDKAKKKLNPAVNGYALVVLLECEKYIEESRNK